MTKLLKYWYIPLLIIGLVFVLKDCSNNDSDIIKELKNKIQLRNEIIKKLVVKKHTIEKIFNGINSKFIEFKKGKSPDKIKTIIVKEIEYVPKTEYIKLYNFAEEFRNNFSLYIKTGNKISDLKDENIEDQKAIIKKVKNDSFGIYTGIEYYKFGNEKIYNAEFEIVKKVFGKFYISIGYKLEYRAVLKSGFCFKLKYRIV